MEIRAASRDRTAIMIAHRLSTVVDAHQILVVESGRVVECGAHAQLLQARGLYARMWNLQQDRAAHPEASAAMA